MAKIAGYEVTSQRPVCVDFSDGRVVSFRPGTRFEAHPTNASVRRLLRVREIRKLSQLESVPTLPVKLGAPKKVTNVLKARRDLKQAKRLAEAKMKASRGGAAVPESIDLGALNRPRSADLDMPGNN